MPSLLNFLSFLLIQQKKVVSQPCLNFLNTQLQVGHCCFLVTWTKINIQLTIISIQHTYDKKYHIFAWYRLVVCCTHEIKLVRGPSLVALYISSHQGWCYWMHIYQTAKKNSATRRLNLATRPLNSVTRPLNFATRQKCNYDPNGLPYTNSDYTLNVLRKPQIFKCNSYWDWA